MLRNNAFFNSLVESATFCMQNKELQPLPADPLAPGGVLLISPGHSACDPPLIFTDDFIAVLDFSILLYLVACCDFNVVFYYCDVFYCFRGC